MDKYVQDISGISSLSGFSYQIRVFVYYLISLEEGMQVEFETVDDVNIKKIKPEEIDNYEANFLNKIVNKDKNKAIQVKRTKISEEGARKVLLNWILLEGSDHKVTKYILFTDDEYKNTDVMFNYTATEFFKYINDSSKGAKATISKVKRILSGDFKKFEQIYDSIRDKYEFVSITNLDEEIDGKCVSLFRKVAVNKVTYYQRIKELLQHVTVKVMDSINEKKPHIFTYNDFMGLVEDISTRITDEVNQPLYADFKKIHTVNFEDLKIAQSREFKQLKACELPDFLLKQHLGYCAYYESLRYSYMESNKLSKIENIEETTYENFESAKHNLKRRNKDHPYNRLDETKKLSNSYADSEQIRYGSGIYLTKDEIEDNQISWKDE
ncbi:hypothetical protein [Halobacillus sp. A5]|uniref:hypothetical protein n=1 Tax=Halobacillus sp. A5 TaxID=2880263 RepID=UPI0020A68123|nr:hypothetical protein [Halobacillus sp. A5]MCP3028768.1 hypothetical protein [Halobacillus sp. A5]